MPGAPALVPRWRCVPGDRSLAQRAGPGRRGGEDPSAPLTTDPRVPLPSRSLPAPAPPPRPLLFWLEALRRSFREKSGQKLEATDRGKGRRKGRRRRAGPGRASPNPPRAPGWGRSAGGRDRAGVPPWSRESCPAPRPCADPRPRRRLECRPTHPPAAAAAADSRPPRRPATPRASPPVLARSLGGSGVGLAPASAATGKPHAFPRALLGAEGRRRSRPAHRKRRRAGGRSGADTARAGIVCARAAWGPRQGALAGGPVSVRPPPTQGAERKA